MLLEAVQKTFVKSALLCEVTTWCFLTKGLFGGNPDPGAPLGDCIWSCVTVFF